MKHQSLGPLNFQSLSNPERTLTDEDRSGKCDFHDTLMSSRLSPNRSRSHASKSLENGEIDICIQVLGVRNRDHEGHNDATSQDSSHNCAGTPVRLGGMHEVYSVGYRTGLDDEIKSAEMRESCLTCSDRDGFEGRAIQDSQETIPDPRQEMIAFDIVCYETNLLTEARHLREKNQVASCPRAVWIGAELLRLAVAEAHSA